MIEFPKTFCEMPNGKHLEGLVFVCKEYTNKDGDLVRREPVVKFVGDIENYLGDGLFMCRFYRPTNWNFLCKKIMPAEFFLDTVTVVGAHSLSKKVEFFENVGMADVVIAGLARDVGVL